MKTMGDWHSQRYDEMKNFCSTGDNSSAMAAEGDKLLHIECVERSTTLTAPNGAQISTNESWLSRIIARTIIVIIVIIVLILVGWLFSSLKSKTTHGGAPEQFFEKSLIFF
mmetsp:Transcript_12677/g.19162  ORF Transcript_12677/g.19162 Transcript_12677/m.19162 type:complete len:111 (-) Transcript_12677:204-536(-)